MNIRVKTTYSYKALVAFNDFCVKSKKFIWITFGATFIWFGLFFAIEYIEYGWVDPELRGLFLFWTFFVLLYAGLTLILPRISLKKAISLNAECTITFLEDKIEETCVSELINESGNYSYKLIHKVCESKDYIYVFVARNRAIILDKNGFESGSEQELKAFLRTKLLEPKKIKFK